MIGIADLGWQEVIIEGYDKKKKRIKNVSSTCLWGADGFPPVSIRWVLVIDPDGELDPLPLMSTDIALSPERIISGDGILRLLLRKCVSILEERRNANGRIRAIARTTPILMSLYTIVCVANQLHKELPLEVAQTALGVKNVMQRFQI